MIRIANKKTYRGTGVYIGRPSLLGNPFHIGTHGTRDEVIAKYRAWLWQQIQARTAVFQELQRLAIQAQHNDLVLLCWCKEETRQVPCHGDIIQAAIRWLNGQDR
ncbi:MAG: DUF4326 domain-containing protein [Blastocatellia bacterium]|nr:DUF4326 domain-containing protein [Blastocatellia bacterium]